MIAALWHRLPRHFEKQLDVVIARGIRRFDFDDGYDDVLRAADALEARRRRGTFYIVSSWIGIPGQATVAQVEELARRGHEIGSHTRSHPLMTRIPPAVKRVEILESLLELAEILDGRPRRLAWPYGYHDDVCDAIALELGLETRGIAPAEVYAPRSAYPSEIRKALSR